MARRGKIWLFNLLLLTVAGLVSVVLVEALVRLAGLDRPRVWEPEPQLGWHAIPGARRHWTEEGQSLIQMNQQGYRDAERQVTKPPGTFRIAVFGDSMTEAVQVNLAETFCTLVEQRLRVRNPRVEVLNFGVSGYSPIQELLLFQREGPRYRPDLIVWVLFLDNDVSGVHPALTVVSQSGPPYVRPQGETLQFDYTEAQRSFREYHREPVQTLRQYSALYRMVSAWRWQRSTAQQSQAHTGMQIPKRFQLYQQSPPPAWEEAWGIFERVVLAFAAEAQHQQVPFFILSAPAAQVVNAQSWAALLRQFPGMATAQWALERPEERLHAFAKQQHLVLLQPYTRFQAAAAGPPLFFGNVGHLTALGHQLMARELEQFLLAQRLVPGGS